MAKNETDSQLSGSCSSKSPNHHGFLNSPLEGHLSFFFGEVSHFYAG